MNGVPFFGFLFSLMVAGVATAEEAEHWFAAIDPEPELTLALRDFNEAGSRPAGVEERGGVRVRSNRQDGCGEIDFPADDADARLELRAEFHPNDFPYIRMRAAFENGTPDEWLVTPSPYEKEMTRRLPGSGAVNGEFCVRLAPDLIESAEPYDREGLAISARWDSGLRRQTVFFDYVLADAFPTRGLCEWDSEFASVVEVLKAEKSQVNPAQSMLGLLARSPEAEIRFAETELQAGEYNTLELRFARPAGAEGPVRIEFENDAGEIATLTVADFPADGEMHRCLIYLYKCPQWRGMIRRISVFPLAMQAVEPVALYFDYVRARFLPVPGAGCISSGFKEAGSMEDVIDEWSESARRIAKWRFVAGQSWGPGNRARMFRNFGRSFKAHRIEWETDVPSQQWLDDSDRERRIVPKVNGKRSPEACARLAYESMNEIGVFLAGKGMRLGAAHFDGVIRHLMCPQHLPSHQKGTLGGFYEEYGGDLQRCYEATAKALCEFFVLCRTEPGSALTDTVFYMQPNLHCWSWEYGPLKCRQIFGNRFEAGNFREAIDVLCRMDKEYEKAGRYGAGRSSPLEGFGADWVFMNLKGPTRLQLISFEWYVTQVWDYKFCVANNGHLKSKTPQERSEHTLEYARLFLERGGRPHSFTAYYWMDPWNDAPLHGSGGEALLPETQPYTFMNTVLQSAKISLREIP